MDFEGVSNSTDNLELVFLRVRFYRSVVPGGGAQSRVLPNVDSSSFSTATATRKVTPGACLTPIRS